MMLILSLETQGPSMQIVARRKRGAGRRPPMQNRVPGDAKGHSGVVVPQEFELAQRATRGMCRWRTDGRSLFGWSQRTEGGAAEFSFPARATPLARGRPGGAALFAVGPGGLARLALAGSAEGEFGVVTQLAGEFAQRFPAPRNPPRRQAHPPSRSVSHRPLPRYLRNALRKYRPGQARHLR